MSAAPGACLICGEPIEYLEQPENMTCGTCGKIEFSNTRCTAGHYICDDCHRAKAVAKVFDLIDGLTGSNPVEVMDILMDQPETHMHGPEHHQLIGCALAVAYHNAGGDLELDQAIPEILRRGGQVPGGVCGFWGACGAGIGSGIFLSIALGQTPLKPDHYGEPNRMTARCLERIAQVGGPRCCKRNCYLSLQEDVPYIASVTGVQMDLPERIVCKYDANNRECIKTACPFFDDSQAL